MKRRRVLAATLAAAGTLAGCTETGDDTPDTAGAEEDGENTGTTDAPSTPETTKTGRPADDAGGGASNNTAPPNVLLFATPAEDRPTNEIVASVTLNRASKVSFVYEPNHYTVGTFTESGDRVIHTTDDHPYIETGEMLTLYAWWGNERQQIDQLMVD
jgi:hypothetical protein